MAMQVKLTAKRGSGFGLKGVVLAAGTAEAQSDTMSLNMDITNLSKGEAIMMLEAFMQKIQASKWPTS